MTEKRDERPLAELNLPPFEANIQERDGARRIFDTLRRRFVALTPEEWVRQNFVHYLTDTLGYRSALMGNEIELRLGRMSRRCDTVVYDRRLRPRMIVEYKRPEVAITQRVFSQISRYNMVMHVDFLVVSNGLQHYCCRMNYAEQTYEFLEQLPTFEEVTGGEKEA